MKHEDIRKVLNSVPTASIPLAEAAAFLSAGAVPLLTGPPAANERSVPAAQPLAGSAEAIARLAREVAGPVPTLAAALAAAPA